MSKPGDKSGASEIPPAFNITRNLSEQEIELLFSKESEDAAKAFIAKNPKFCFAQNDKGLTALMIAAQGGDYNIAKALIDARARPDIKDKEGHDALYWTQPNDQNMIKLLGGRTIEPPATEHLPVSSEIPVAAAVSHLKESGRDAQASILPTIPEPTIEFAASTPVIHSREREGLFTDKTAKTASLKPEQKTPGILTAVGKIMQRLSFVGATNAESRKRTPSISLSTATLEKESGYGSTQLDSKVHPITTGRNPGGRI